MTDSDIDELFDVKTSLYIGNYQNCIKEAQSIKNLTQEKRLECDCLMYRAYIAQRKYGIVLNEVTSSSHPQLQAIRLFSDYLSADSIHKEEVLSELELQISANIDISTTMFFIMAANIYYHENNLESALRILNQIETIESISLSLQIYLNMNRVDMAKKELMRLQELDEDATLTQLAQAWFNLSVGGDKLQDAYFIFQEMADKHTNTPLLLNGMAASFIAQGKIKDIEGLLQESLSKDNDNAETMANMSLLSQLLSKSPEISRRYVSQLKDANKNHSFVISLLNKEKEFERLSKNYQVSVPS